MAILIKEHKCLGPIALSGKINTRKMTDYEIVSLPQFVQRYENISLGSTNNNQSVQVQGWLPKEPWKLNETTMCFTIRMDGVNLQVRIQQLWSERVK